MKIRLCISILMLGALSIISNYHIKAPFSDPLWCIYGAIIGLLYMEFMRFSFKKKPEFSKNFLLHTVKDPFKSHLYFCSAGIFYGWFTGYNISIIYNSYLDLSTLKATLLSIICLISVFTILVLLFIENYKVTRIMFVLMFDKSTQEIDPIEFYLSLFASLIIGDYVSVISLAYGGFFAAMYYNIYLAYLWNSLVFGYVVGGFCGFTIIANIFKYYFVTKERREQQKLKQELGVLYIGP